MAGSAGRTPHLRPVGILFHAVGPESKAVDRGGLSGSSCLGCFVGGCFRLGPGVFRLGPGVFRLGPGGFRFMSCSKILSAEVTLSRTAKDFGDAVREESKLSSSILHKNHPKTSKQVSMARGRAGAFFPKNQHLATKCDEADWSPLG